MMRIDGDGVVYNGGETCRTMRETIWMQTIIRDRQKIRVERGPALLNMREDRPHRVEPNHHQGAPVFKRLYTPSKNPVILSVGSQELMMPEYEMDPAVVEMILSYVPSAHRVSKLLRPVLVGTLESRMKQAEKQFICYHDHEHDFLRTECQLCPSNADCLNIFNASTSTWDGNPLDVQLVKYGGIIQEARSPAAAAYEVLSRDYGISTLVGKDENDVKVTTINAPEIYRQCHRRIAQAALYDGNGVPPQVALILMGMLPTQEPTEYATGLVRLLTGLEVLDQAPHGLNTRFESVDSTKFPLYEMETEAIKVDDAGNIVAFTTFLDSWISFHWNPANQVWYEKHYDGLGPAWSPQLSPHSHVYVSDNRKKAYVVCSRDPRGSFLCQKPCCVPKVRAQRWPSLYPTSMMEADPGRWVYGAMAINCPCVSCGLYRTSFEKDDAQIMERGVMALEHNLLLLSGRDGDWEVDIGVYLSQRGPLLVPGSRRTRGMWYYGYGDD